MQQPQMSSRMSNGGESPTVMANDYDMGNMSDVSVEDGRRKKSQTYRVRSQNAVPVPVRTVKTLAPQDREMASNVFISVISVARPMERLVT